VPEFLAEQYDPGAVEADVRRRATALQRACQRLATSDVGVRVIFARYVPADEVVFVHLEAESVGAVEEAARQAGISFDRISLSLSVLDAVAGGDDNLTERKGNGSVNGGEAENA
jgi:hypothetical protein